MTTYPHSRPIYKEGYYWVIYKDFKTPWIVQLKFESWDHTQDGDRWVLWEGDTEILEEEFFKYRFIQYIPEPPWPWEDVNIIEGHTNATL